MFFFSPMVLINDNNLGFDVVVQLVIVMHNMYCFLVIFIFKIKIFINKFVYKPQLQTIKLVDFRFGHIYRYSVKFCGWNPVNPIDIHKSHESKTNSLHRFRSCLSW